MAAEGEYPKIDGDVFYGSEANDNDRTISICQNINQSTILSEDATVTDITYEKADTDTMSDTTGYNDTVNTGQTTARFLGNRYVLSSTVYDDFDDNSFDTGLWTATPASGTVTEQNQRLELACAGDSTITYVETDTNYTDYLRWDAQTISGIGGAGNQYYAVYIGGTVIVDLLDHGGTYNDYATGTWEIFKTGASTHDLYKDQVFVRTISSALSGAVKFDARSSHDAKNHFIDNVSLNFDSAAFVQTDTKTFGSNVKSIFVYANDDTTLSGTSVTYDVSSDGGAAFEKTAQALNTWVALDGDDTDIELKINLNRGSTSTPWLFGYSYLVRT